MRGVAPVRVAAEGGRAAVVAELLDWCPAAAGCGDVRGHRPLRRAAYHGHADVVETLLARGGRVPERRRDALRKRAAGGPTRTRWRRRRGSSRCATPLPGGAQRIAGLRGGVGGGAPDAWTRAGGRRGAWRRSARRARRDARLGGDERPNGRTIRTVERRRRERTAGTAGRSASERNRASRNNRAAVDAVLERAGAGTPLLWSRASHRLFPERFRRDAGTCSALPGAPRASCAARRRPCTTRCSARTPERGRRT